MLYFYTAVYGDHIPLPEFDTKGFEFRCYTDCKIESKTWKVFPEAARHKNPRMAAKWRKLHPPLIDGDISIWIDASITVTDVHAMVKACKAALKGHDVALFKHPERNNIFDEAAVSVALPKYAGLPLIQQVESYAEEGLPCDAGLWAGGVIVRKHSPKYVHFENDWWEENTKWSYQDQLSLPYVLWKHNVHPGVIPGSVYKTAFHTWTPTADPVKSDPEPLPIPTTHPLLSVITPTHNVKWLADCWASLKSQTYTNFEWLVSVNDAAGKREALNQTAAAVKAIVGDDLRVKILHDHAPFSHVGQRKAYAFGMATGDAVIEYDHDDLLTPDALAEIAQAFYDPEVGFVYSDFADFHDGRVDEKGKPIQGNLTYRHPEVRPGWITSGFKFYEANVLARVRPGKYECVDSPEPTARVVSHIYTAPNHVRAWRRSVYEKIGGHDQSFRIADDHELICRTYLATKFRHIKKPLYLYRISGENTWAQNVQAIKDTSDRIQNDYLERLVLRECELLGVDAIELGGGIDPRAGWKACDLEGAPIIADLREKWPWPDNSVGAFRASDLLEHLPNKMHTMSEIHRCLRPGGWLISMTPSSEGWGADADPTHVSRWNPMCVAAGTRVLCADFSWRSVDDLKKGDAIVGFDETPSDSLPARGSRLNLVRMRKAVVQANEKLRMSCIRVSTDRGIPMIASTEHPWLVQRWAEIPGQRNGKLYRRLTWVRTKDLNINDEIVHIGKPWDYQNTRDAGWLAGMFDGEGCFHITKRNDGDTVNLIVTQRASNTLDRLKTVLTSFGFEFSDYRVKSKENWIHSLHILGGRRAIMRVLGMIRPERFMDRDLSGLYDGVWLRRGKTFETAAVTDLAMVGSQVVYGTQTSTRTLITNGYYTHNSFWYYTRDASARYIRNTTMRFAEVHLDTVPINIQGVTVPYVRADLVKL